MMAVVWCDDDDDDQHLGDDDDGDDKCNVPASVCQPEIEMVVL